MSIAHVTTESHVDVHGLCCHLKPCWYLCAIGATLIWVTCTTIWDHVMSKSILPQRTTSGSMVLPQPGSLLISMARADVLGLCYSLNPFWSLWSGLRPRSLFESVSLGLCSWLVLSPENTWKPMICAPANYKEQESYSGSDLISADLQLKKRDMEGFCDNPYPPSPPKVTV